MNEHDPTPSGPTPVLVAEGICKSFPGVRALDDAQLTLRPGEIHALMGENGAGKSTIIKVINGVLQPDAGSIMLDLKQVQPTSVRDAEQMGISTVFQEVNLVPMRSVAENLFLGRFPKKFGLVRWWKMRRMAEAQIRRFGLKMNVTQPVCSYSIALQQMVAIVRAVNAGRGEAGEAGETERRTKVLILDEPTSSLDTAEIAQLFTVMRRLRDEGMAILFVTHFLDQVYAVCDRITVMRNGQFVGEYETEDLPKLKLVGAMTGRDIDPDLHPSSAGGEAAAAHERAMAADEAAAGREPAAIQVRQLGKRRMLQPVDFDVRRGEIVGLAGLLGSGRTETARLCFGADQADEGALVIDGQEYRFSSPRQAIQHGLAMTTEDRKASGIAPNLSVRENLILALQSRRGMFKVIGRAEQQALVDKYIKLLKIKTPSAEQPIRLLSGGNQQKVLLARWLATEPRLLILDEPTRGIDVGAKAEIAKLVRELSHEGMGVLFISAELEEVAGLCRHVVVLRDRRPVGELRGAEISEKRIMNLIAGPAADPAAAPPPEFGDEDGTGGSPGEQESVPTAIEAGGPE